MLFETNSKPQKTDVSRISEKSDMKNDQGFSDYMDRSSEKSSVKPASKVESQELDSRKSEAIVERDNSNTVAEQKSTKVDQDKEFESDSTTDKGNDKDAEKVAVNSDDVVVNVKDDEEEISTAALVNLMLQRAIKSNIEDSPSKLKNLENTDLANQKQTSALDALIQKTALATEIMNKDIFENQSIKQSMEKMSPELAKLLLADEKDSANAGKLHNLNNKQELIAQMQLKPVDEVMDIKQENGDLIDKLLEKLDLTKNKGEVLFQNRMVGDRSAVMAEVSELNLNRMASENSDKNILLNSLNSSDRINNTTVAQQMKMNVPVSSPEWGAEFGKRIQMLMKNNIQHAEIRMDPPELGRIQVRINMNQDQANISFTALHANVREAIESNITRLRDMLGESGLQLGEADVGSEFQQQTNQRSEEQGQFAVQKQVIDSVDENDMTDIPAAVVQHSIDGVIDYFA